MKPLKTLAALLLFIVIGACDQDALEMSELNKQNLLKTESETSTVDDGCETAFAKWTPTCLWEGYVFASNPNLIPDGVQSLNLTQNRWGWAINIPDNHNTTGTFELWAGAAKNDTSKGMLVGTVTVVRSANSGLVVTYNVVSGYSIKELHVYASDIKPTTIAPGQFGHTKEFDPGVSSYSKDFTPVVDTDGDGVWVIAHAVVCSD